MMSADRKLAVCLYGRFGNRFNDDAGRDGLDYLTNHILKDVDADFFVHSYDVRHEEDVRKALGAKLKASHFGPAPDHLREFLDRGGDPSLFKPDDASRNVSGTFSFCAQRDGALSLMVNHSRFMESAYSHVLVCRVDIGQIDNYNQRHPQRVSEVPGLANFAFSSPQVVHAAWNQLNAGLPDQWFILDIASAMHLAGSLGRFMDYLLPGSDYLKFCESGIAWSSASREFSNEQTQFRPKGDLAVRPVAKALDNHLLHKYDFIKIGLFGHLSPGFDSKGMAHLCYTHSSYLDGWKLTSREQRKHLGLFSREYLAIESGPAGDALTAGHGIEKIFYDEARSYTDRLLQVLKHIEDEYVFFTHEDMPLLGTPVTNALFEAKLLLDKRPEHAVVRMIRVGRGIQLNLDRPSRLPYFSPIHFWSRWKFSIQPSLWKKALLIALLEECQGLNVWEFEVRGQREFRKIGLVGFQPITSGGRRGRHHFDSALYPYVATAIVKGKWNLEEYPELEEMLQSLDLSEFPTRESLSKA
jgi:hypothetical protein